MVKYLKINIKPGILTFVVMVLFMHSAQAQSFRDSINKAEEKMERLKISMDSMTSVLETLRLRYIQDEIQSAGYPDGATDEEITTHPGLAISYNETHELANWVAHMILPQIEEGNLGRPNDFRPDTTISTGTAVKKDYFLKYLQEDSTYENDGFGFDRGHLAPSADYRWSKTAMSATYYYSNITPQRPDFNRGGWAKLENFLRDYVIQNETPVVVYTGPVLSDDLPVIERSVNKLSIPEYHYKIAWDKENQRSIAFVISNDRLDKPIETYAVTVDSVERLTGLDFFPELSDETQSTLESDVNPESWFSGESQNDKLPLEKSDMPDGAFNTINARAFMGANKKATVCGTVVSTHKSDKGNTFINLDKSFPEQIFTVTIWEQYQNNFPYEPHIFLENKRICVTGKVQEFGETPSISLENENNLEILE
ncbi:MAG: DNA/RNA non-specific endonuclease [Bacteroidota bacterium]